MNLLRLLIAKAELFILVWKIMEKSLDAQVIMIYRILWKLYMIKQDRLYLQKLGSLNIRVRQ